MYILLLSYNELLGGLAEISFVEFKVPFSCLILFTDGKAMVDVGKDLIGETLAVKVLLFFEGFFQCLLLLFI